MSPVPNRIQKLETVKSSWDVLYVRLWRRSLNGGNFLACQYLSPKGRGTWTLFTWTMKFVSPRVIEVDSLFIFGRLIWTRFYLKPKRGKWLEIMQYGSMWMCYLWKETYLLFRLMKRLMSFPIIIFFTLAEWLYMSHNRVALIVYYNTPNQAAKSGWQSLVTNHRCRSNRQKRIGGSFKRLT